MSPRSADPGPGRSRSRRLRTRLLSRRALRREIARLTELIDEHAAILAERDRLHAEQEQLARRDPLTHLANRRAFDEDLALERDRARRHGNPVSLVMVDLDRFKAINDTHGHPAGDRVLCVVADALRKALRSSDTAYRLGGEEFAVIARDTDVLGAQVLAERLRSRLEARVALGPDDSAQVSVTASFGVAELGTVELDIARLVATADAALLAAKRSGRNRVEARSCGAEILAAIT